MKRFLLLLVCGALLCGSWSGGPADAAMWSLFPQKPAAHAVDHRVALLGDDPVPPGPAPNPAPNPAPAPQPAPQPPRPAPDSQPFVALPSTLSVAAGGWLEIDAQTNCRSVRFVSPDPGLNIFPARKLADPLGTVVSSMSPGQYRIMAFAAAADVPVASEWCIVTVTGAQPPPGPGPGPGPKPDPAPIAKATKLRIAVIDNAQTRTPDRTKFLMDPYWATVRGKHQADHYNTTRADVMANCAEQLKANGGTGTPIIIVMDAATGKWLNRDPADLKLPADAGSLKALIAKFTDNVP